MRHLIRMRYGLYRNLELYSAWLCSDAKARLWAYTVLHEKGAIRSHHPYILYLSHPRSDVRGIESLHQLLYVSYTKRSQQFASVVHYPQYMCLLFLCIKTFIAGTSQAYVEGVIGVVVWLGMASVCRLSVLDALNRYVFYGKGMSAQIPFELWSVLRVLQRQGCNWQELPQGDTRLLKELEVLFRSIQMRGSLEKYLLECGKHPFADVEACWEDYERHYSLQSMRWSLLTAGLYYGFIVFVAVSWLLWVTEPIQQLERQWMGL